MSTRFEDLTEDELIDWYERHDDIIAWEGMWNSLATVFALIGLCLVLFTGQGMAALAFSGLAILFVLARVRCQYKHGALHAERGQYIDE